MALTEELIRDTYNKLKEKAALYFEKGNVQKGLLYTHLAANTNYAFWLSYFDDEIEDLAKKAGSSIVLRAYNSSNIVRGHCVMLDSMARYRGGLTVQYINAIVSSGWELLYITEQEMNAPHHKELLDYINTIESVTILEVPSKIKGAARLQYVYDSILNFSPERLFFHGTTSDAFFTAICYSLPSSIIKFFIDVADHSFRMGMKACDYSFEFRDLGCSIATNYLNYPKEKILKLPFYPVMDNSEFKGLPSECDGKIIIISGGIFWKIVDQTDTFFRLCQKILFQNPNAIIVYPGGGDPSCVKNKLREYGIDDRFLLLGWRDDISSLFKKADIFLNTYPHGGGTMSQYAAHFKIPILSFQNPGICSNPVELFVCQINRTEVSSVGEEAFLAEAHKLINNREYRQEKADRVYSCVLDCDLFNKYFKDLFENRNNILPFNTDRNVDISSTNREKKLRYHSETGEYQTRLVTLTGINSITFRPQFIVPFVKSIIPKIIRVFKRSGFHFNKI